MSDRDDTVRWSYFTWAAKVPDVRRFDEGLNALGVEGWELVTSTSTVKTWMNVSGNDVVLIFKKQGAGERPSAAALKAVTGIDPDIAY